MPEDHFRSPRCARERLPRTVVTRPSPENVGVPANPGFDCPFLYTEHRACDAATRLAAVRA